MKKKVNLILAAVLIFTAFAGCSKSQPSETTPTITTSETIASTEIKTTSVSDTTQTIIEETYQPDQIPMSDYSELPTINNSEMGALFESFDQFSAEPFIMYRAMSWEPGSPIPWFMRLWLTDHDNVSGIDWMSIPCVPDTVLDSKDSNDQNVWSGPIFAGRIRNYANIISEFNNQCESACKPDYSGRYTTDLLIGQTYTSNSGETAVVDYRLMFHILVEYSDEHPDHQLSSEVFEVFGYTEEEVRNYVYEIDDENPILDYSLINTDNAYYDV